MPLQLRVRAVDGASLPSIDEKGYVRPAHFVGINKRGERLPGGEVVRDHQHYRRAINRGELELLEEIDE